MTVEGLHSWPTYKVVVKDQHGKVYGRVNVIAPNRKDAIEAAQKEAQQRWGYPDTLTFTCMLSQKEPQFVVHYV